MTRKVPLSIIISIILLITINILSLTTIHIPIGEDIKQTTVDHNIEKGEYGYTLDGVWYSFGSIVLEHPLRKQQIFRRCDRIKDRFPELLFA